MDLSSSLRAFAPELVLTATIFAVLVADLLMRSRTDRRRTGVLIALSLIGAGGALAWAASLLTRDLTATFSGMLALDPFAQFFRLFFLLVALVALVMAALSDEISRSRLGEYLLLLLTVTLGLTLLSSSKNLLMMYLSLELVSIPSYVLAGFKQGDRRSSEAALKYVIYGGVASGLTLFGFSLLYGLAHTLDVAQVGHQLAALQYGPATLLALVVALVLSLAGFAYKVAGVPFHMWAPDVYEGAPTPFTAFLSVGPKAAGFAVLIRFLLTAFGDPAGATVPWNLILAIMAALTMTVGNLTALVQNNLKRLLAFSSIAHAGYLLMAVAVGSWDAVRAVELYLVFYMLMNLGAFLCVQVVRDRVGSEQMAAYVDLRARSPLLALLLAVFLLSLIGLPPLAGFVGKFYLFAAVLQARSALYYVLALIGVLNSAIALYYYARVLRAMYLEKSPADQLQPSFSLSPATTALLLLLAVPTLLLGIFWFPLADALTGAATLFH
ncbi:MAG: NADH-quinone oxidoreductase subunit N [Bradymonadales bacterium]|nr:NADH-quinone oxidoreductase subunit N [Bradymonadales bacterium]